MHIFGFIIRTVADVSTHNTDTVDSCERVTEEAHYCGYSKTDCTG